MQKKRIVLAGFIPMGMLWGAWVLLQNSLYLEAAATICWYIGTVAMLIYIGRKR